MTTSDPLTHVYLKIACGILFLILAFVVSAHDEIQTIRVLMKRREPSTDPVLFWTCVVSFVLGLAFLIAGVTHRIWLFHHR
ncbi:MAG: hypothetical protein ACRYGG_03150 [Janthinobacterium lividum]